MSERRALHAGQAGGHSPRRVLRACGPAALTLVTGMHRRDVTGADAQDLAAPASLPGNPMSSKNSKRARQRVPQQLNDVQGQRATGNLAPLSVYVRKTFGVRPQRLCANMVRV